MVKPKDVSIAFSGAGFLGCYYAGVILCLKRFAPEVNIVSATGASAGALAACCLLSRKPVDEYIASVLLLCNSIRRFTMGSFSPCCHLDDILKETFDEILPNDILDDVNGRLHISLTRVRDKKNFLISEFSSKEDLIDCIRASSFVPVFSGMIPPIFRGERFMDGMFTDNLPKIFEQTVTVSPFSGVVDICPALTTVPKYQINWANTSFALTWDNVRIFWMSAWPQTNHTLMHFAEDGFKRTMTYLISKDYIKCKDCHAKMDSEESFKPCEQCRLVRFDHLQKGLPEDIQEIIKNTDRKEQEDRGKYVIPHTVSNSIAVILLPVTLPIELLIAITLFCIPCFFDACDLVKEYFVIKDVTTVVTIALLIPIEICSVLSVFVMKYVYNTLRNFEEVVLLGIKLQFSSIDYNHVKDRAFTYLLMGVILPLEIWNVLFVYFPYVVATNLRLLRNMRIRLSQDL